MACEIFSSLNYPVSVSYGKETIEIPPRATKLLVMDEKKLGALPKGVRKVKIGKKEG